MDKAQSSNASHCCFHFYLNLKIKKELDEEVISLNGVP